MMQTDAPLLDVAHSNKAIVIVTAKHEFMMSTGRAMNSSEVGFTNQNIAVSAANHGPPNQFEATERISTYLIDPGKYTLSYLNDRGTREFLGFQPNQSPAGFSVSAGDVVYLGELHVVSVNSGCDINQFFSVRDAMNDDRAAIDRMLDSKYPGARERLRKSLLTVFIGGIGMKRVGVICFQHAP